MLRLARFCLAIFAMGGVGTVSVAETFTHDAFHAWGLRGGDDHEDGNTITFDGQATAQYVVQGGKWAQPGGLGTPVSITYSYNNLLHGGLKDGNGVSLPVALLRASIEEALGLWASVAPLHFIEVEDEGTIPVPRSAYPNGQFGQIRFHEVYINGPDIPGQDPIAKAQAYFPSAGGNLAGDVYFDHGDPWQEVGTISQPDVLGAAIHELGHALGLGHTNVGDANMYWVFRRTSGLGTGVLHADDIAGIRAIYGTGVGSVTPQRLVPEPASALAMLASVWLVALRPSRARRFCRGR